MYSLPKAVEDKVTELQESIKKAKEDLQIECAETSLNGNFSQLTLLTAKHGYLQVLEADIISALNQFENKSKEKQPVNSKVLPPKSTIMRTRTSGGRMRVSLAGNVIEQPTIALTFFETIKAFGVENVARLNKTASGIPLCSTAPTTGYQRQHQTGNWFVTTHLNRNNAKSLLENIAKELNVSIRVEFA